MAYLVKPRLLAVEQADAPEDFASLPLHASGIPLSERISRSHGLALILVISEFSQKNATALGALREWANEKFDKDPTFIYATQATHHAELPASIFSSFVYNLFAGPRIMAEEEALRFVRRRMHVFHATDAFAQLKSDFYESFGRDREAAELLAQYEFDQARKSVPAILAAWFWIIVTAFGIYRFCFVHRAMRDKIQNTLSGLWFVLALFYLIEAWTQNSVPVMLSSLLCAAIGLYLRRPLIWTRGEDRGLSLRLVTLGAKSLTLITFLTLSLMGIHLLTWIKTGTIDNPDPIMLLSSAITGNFFHEPVELKRNLGRLIGILWLLALGICLRILMLEREPDLEAPERLDQLKTMPPTD